MPKVPPGCRIVPACRSGAVRASRRLRCDSVAARLAALVETAEAAVSTWVVALLALLHAGFWGDQIALERGVGRH